MSISRHGYLFAYALLLGCSLVVFKLLDASLINRSLQWQVYAGIIALVFTAIGIWAGLKFKSTSTPPSPQSAIEFDPQQQIELGISSRELEVLECMASGKSNREIADALFISENTVKTHVSSLLQKLNAKRRTEALHIARSKGLLAPSADHNHPKV